MTLTYSSYIYHFKCILLTVRCFPEATVGGEPGCEVPFIAACSFNYYYYYYYYYFPNLIAFLRAKTCSKSHETLHTPQKWRKFTSDMGFKSGCGKMARQRHLYTFNGVRLELRFTYMYENRYTHVTHQYLPKSLLKQNPKPNRKLVIFN